MTLAPPERLLALLVRAPSGVARTTVTDELADPDSAIAVLVERGHRVIATASGWRLECAPRHFDPQRFESLRQGDFGAPLEIHEEADSTNDLARRAARSGAPPGATWLAEYQRAGRGRQGRVWECAAHAGLLASVLVDTDSTAPATWLPLAVGLGACMALRRATDNDVRPKWPNDLWIGTRKLAGILVEIVVGRRSAVVGIGVNVRRTQVDPAPGVALEDCGPVPGREALLATLLASIEEHVGLWRRGDIERLGSAYEALEITLGRAVTALVGTETVHGRAVGLSAGGLLQLETSTGAVRELAAGEVHLL